MRTLRRPLQVFVARKLVAYTGMLAADAPRSDPFRRL